MGTGSLCTKVFMFATGGVEDVMLKYFARWSTLVLKVTEIERAQNQGKHRPPLLSGTGNEKSLAARSINCRSHTPKVVYLIIMGSEMQ